MDGDVQTDTDKPKDPMHPAERALREALAVAKAAHDAAIAAGFRIEPANFGQLLEQLAISETARVVHELEEKAEGQQA